jgi:predicted DNA-binding transcriptional regulator YafY
VTPPQGFSLQEYLNSGEFSYRQSDERITLKLRMAEDRALHLKETRLHPDQAWADVGNGTVEITAQVHDSLQLRFWLNGFGADVEVLEPLEFREEFAEQARELARCYQKKTAPSRHTASIARGDQP